MQLKTEEIMLVAATREQIAAAIQAPGDVAEQVGATAARDWDAALYCEGAPYVVRDMNEADVGWWHWWVLHRQSPEQRAPTLVGFGGFKGPPTRGGNVEMMYGLAPSAQGRGVATATVKMLIQWAFRSSAVKRVLLTIDPTNRASLAVAERCGFTHVQDESDEAFIVLKFERNESRIAGGSR